MPIGHGDVLMDETKRTTLPLEVQLQLSKFFVSNEVVKKLWVHIIVEYSGQPRDPHSKIEV